MPSVSSLLKSAQATQKKMRTQEDAFVAFEWENSAQTYDDFVEYSKYLNERIKTAGDPGDALSYQTKLRSANRSYTSNEIQRQQMNIMEGRGTTQDKMDSIKELWQRAMGAEDFNLAQNLVSQWDSLSIKLQGEMESEAKARESATRSYLSNNKKAADNLIKDLQKGFEDVTLPDGTVVTGLGAIKEDIEKNGTSPGTWKAAADTMKAMRNMVESQWNSATSQDDIDKLEAKYGPQLSNIDEELTFKAGGQTLNASQVLEASINEDFNNPMFGLKQTSKLDPSTGKMKATYELVENKIDRLDNLRRINPETGEEEYLESAYVRTPEGASYFGEGSVERSLDAMITNEGQIVGNELKDKQGYGNIALGTDSAKREDNMTIRERLQSALPGIRIETKDGKLQVVLPGENTARFATIQPDGSLRFIGDDGKIKEVGAVNRKLYGDFVPQEQRIGEAAGEIRDVSNEEVSDFGTQSIFGGNLSSMSKRGQRYTQSILGNTNFTAALKEGTPIKTGNDFRGFGGAAMGSSLQGTSGLLQGAASNRKAIAAEKAAQAAAQEALMQQTQRDAASRLQATRTFNLNQTPVASYTSAGFRIPQLEVKPIVTPTITKVGVAQPTQTISSVGVAPTTQRVSGVSVAGPMPTIRF